MNFFGPMLVFFSAISLSNYGQASVCSNKDSLPDRYRSEITNICNASLDNRSGVFFATFNGMPIPLPNRFIAITREKPLYMYRSSPEIDSEHDTTKLFGNIAISNQTKHSDISGTEYPEKVTPILDAVSNQCGIDISMHETLVPVGKKTTLAITTISTNNQQLKIKDDNPYLLEAMLDTWVRLNCKKMSPLKNNHR